MANTDANIAVRIGADLTPLQRDLRNAARQTKGFASTLGKLRGPIGAAAAAGAAAGAAFGVMAQQAGESAKEIKALSRVSGVGVQRFQELAFAAQSVGIQQDKLADIFKDARDKVGDFLQTGGGALVDYFENVAPLVGQTAEEFRNLSGPEVLQKLQKGLDAANVSMSEQIFHLEALASDASMLQPLLTNNAKGMEALAKNARDLNATLTADELNKLTKVASGFDAISQQLSTETSRAVAYFEEEITSALNNAVIGIAKAGQAFGFFFDRFSDDKKTIAGVRDELDRVIGRSQFLKRIIAQGIDNPTKRLEAQQELNQLEERYHELQAQEIEILKRKTKAEEQFQILAKNGIGIKSGGGAGKSEADKQLEREKNVIAQRAKLHIEEFNKQQELERQRIDQQLEDSIKRLDNEQAYYDAIENRELEHYKKRTENLNNFIAGTHELWGHSWGGITNLVEMNMGRQEAAVVSGLGSVLSAMSTHSKKAFELNKKVSLASAVIDGYESAVAAWKQGMKVGGPPVAAAFTAASLAQTGALISSIQAQSYGGGGNQSVGGGINGGAALPGASTAPQQNQVVSINLEGEVFGRDQVRGLIGQINDALDDGYTLRV